MKLRLTFRLPIRMVCLDIGPQVMQRIGFAVLILKWMSNTDIEIGCKLQLFRALFRVAAGWATWLHKHLCTVTCERVLDQMTPQGPLY